MKMDITLKAAGLAAALAFCAPVTVMAQDDPWPLEGGEYVEVTGIELADGASLKYAQWLAGEWRQNNDFAVQQGWINRYEILLNEHPREGEPDIYLIYRFPKFVDNAELDRRNKIMMERMKRSEETLQKESADRADYRKVLSSMLLRSLDWKK